MPAAKNTITAAISVFIDNLEQGSGSWSSGIDITFKVDDLSVGFHNITIVLWDLSGNSVTDTVILSVEEIPTITTSTDPSSSDSSISSSKSSSTTSTPTSNGFELSILLVSLLIIRKIRFRKIEK